MSYTGYILQVDVETQNNTSRTEMRSVDVEGNGTIDLIIEDYPITISLTPSMSQDLMNALQAFQPPLSTNGKS